MKKNTKFDLDRLSKLPILEVAEKLGLQLNKNKCHCFLHEEKTPSFSINPRKNMWKCFGCDKGGGVIKLVEKYYGYDFTEACKWLSSAFGIWDYRVRQPVRQVKISTIKYTSNNTPDTEIYQWFFDNLFVTDKVKQFIDHRRYPIDIIEKYNLKGLDNCNEFFKKCTQKWGKERLLKCGLAKEVANEETGEISIKFNWWTNMLFIPYYNAEEKIIFMQGRKLNPIQENKFKYVNLYGVETYIFNSQILKTIPQNNDLIITEGVTDCISCGLMGHNAVGIPGAGGFKNEYVQLLKDFNIIVIPDNDNNKTGEKLANRIKEAFRAIGKNVRIFPLDPKYKDITEYYTDTAKQWGY